jgi:ribonucleotide reductase alpha subunit
MYSFISESKSMNTSITFTRFIEHSEINEYIYHIYMIYWGFRNQWIHLSHLHDLLRIQKWMNTSITFTWFIEDSEINEYIYHIYMIYWAFRNQCIYEKNNFQTINHANVIDVFIDFWMLNKSCKCDRCIHWFLNPQ